MSMASKMTLVVVVVVVVVVETPFQPHHLDHHAGGATQKEW